MPINTSHFLAHYDSAEFQLLVYPIIYGPEGPMMSINSVRLRLIRLSQLISEQNHVSTLALPVELDWTYK